MPIIACPTCQASLTHEPFAATVRCEKCRAEWAIPDVSTAVTTTPPSRRVDDEPAPPHRRRESSHGDAVIDRSSDPNAWRTGRNGIRVAMCGAAIVVLVNCMLVFVAKALAPDGRMEPLSLGLALIVGVGLALLGSLVHLVGQAMCCFSPTPYHSPAIRFFVYLGVTVAGAVLYVYGAAMAAMEMRQGGRPAYADYLSVAPLLIALLTIITLGYWLTYLQEVSKKFGAAALAAQCKAYMMALLAIIFFGIAAPIALAFSDDFRRDHSIDTIISLVQAALGLWYLAIMVQVNGVVGRAVDAGRIES